MKIEARELLANLLRDDVQRHVVGNLPSPFVSATFGNENRLDSKVTRQQPLNQLGPLRDEQFSISQKIARLQIAIHPHTRVVERVNGYARHGGTLS